jgi:16S rRNA (guanine966-N2)-methyltransferase
MPRSTKPQAKQSQLRIIGGRWRSRKLDFSAAPGLRPTTDRIRETLFNWLSPVIQEARCADLFAGSGALGLEALSRGASHCDFIEAASAASSQIQRHLATLDAQALGRCHAMTAEQFLAAATEPWDIVFIDPPFGMNLVNPACSLLADKQLLREGATVYVETAADDPSVESPSGWTLHREKRAGAVIYRLYHAEAE